MSAPVLTKEQVKDIKRTWPEHTFVFRLADSHEALRAECEAVRADRDSLWTTVNKVKAERDALKARVAVLAAECRAWRLAHEAASPAAFAGDMERIGHAEDAYELMHRSIDVMMEVTRAATDANGGLDA